ncbi:hypothetical protein [Microlunatus antarcticus]
MNDPILTLFGLSWSLNISCPWSVPELGFNADTPNSGDRVPELVGLDLLRLDVVEGRLPAFQLSAGVSIVVDDADDPNDEPWVMSLPSLVITAGTQSPYWS